MMTNGLTYEKTTKVQTLVTINLRFKGRSLDSVL